MQQERIDTAAVEERVRADLDLVYVTSTGRFVAEQLAAGVPVEANYQPGDGTRYGLVFVPLWAVATAPGRVAPIRALGDEPRVWDSRAIGGGSYGFGWTLVAKDDGYAQGLNLTHGKRWHPSYLVGRWVDGYASACAISLLFDAICHATPERA